jgi:hypothetical protein
MHAGRAKLHMFRIRSQPHRATGAQTCAAVILVGGAGSCGLKKVGTDLLATIRPSIPQTWLRPQTLVPHAAGSAVLTACWAGHCCMAPACHAPAAPHLLRSLTSCPPASWLHGCWPHNVVLHAHAGRSQRRHRRSNAASPLLPSRERLHHHGYLGSAAASYRRLRPCGKRSRQCRRRARRAVPAHEGKHNLSNADGYRLRDQVGEWGCGDGR